MGPVPSSLSLPMVSSLYLSPFPAHFAARPALTCPALPCRSFIPQDQYTAIKSLATQAIVLYTGFLTVHGLGFVRNWV